MTLQFRSCPSKLRKLPATVQRAQCGRLACIQWGAFGYPKGIVYVTAISTPVPCSLQLDTFHLGLCRLQPR